MNNFPKILRNSFKIIFLNLIIIAIGVLFLEAAVRIFFPQPYYAYPQHMFKNDPILGYRLTPSFSGRHCQPDFCVQVKFNSLGLRDDEFDIDEEYDYKILILGDSVAFGNGVEFKESSLKILEEEFSKSFPGKKIRVIKAGIPGYCTAEELLYFKHYGHKFRPDLVITIFMQNDLSENTRKHHRKVVNGYLVPFEYSRISRIRLFLNSKSQLYCFLKNKIFNNREIKKLFDKIFYSQRFNGDKNDLKLKEAFTTTQEYISQLDKEIHRQGARHIMVLVPDFSPNPRCNINERIVKFCKQNNIDVFDTTSEFTEYTNRCGRDLLFKTDRHLDITGNRVFGEIIYKFLKDKIVLD